MGKRSQSSPAAKAGASIPRTALVADVLDAAFDGQVVALVSERGMGKQRLIDQVISEVRAQSIDARVFRFSRRSAENSYRRLRSLATELLSGEVAPRSCFVFVEDVTPLSDSLGPRIAGILEALRCAGILVLLSMEPCAEALLDGLPRVYAVYAEDLVIGDAEFDSWSEYFPCVPRFRVRDWTHGIPALVPSIRGARVDATGYLEGDRWDKVCSELVGNCSGPWLIDEEALLRCAMLLLGQGSLSDASDLGIRVSRDMVRSLERDVPLLGVSSRDGCFRVIPCNPAVIGVAMVSSCRRWPWMIGRATELLAARGDAFRAGAIASACKSLCSPASLALRYPIELIDAGMAALLKDVLEEDRGGEAGRRQAQDALCLCGGLPWSRYGKPLGRPNEPKIAVADETEPDLRGLTGLQLELLRACHRVRTGPVGRPGDLPADLVALSSAAAASGDRIARVMACHARALSHALSGASLEAFRELTMARELRGLKSMRPSVFAATLQMDFEAARLVIADPEGAADRDATLRAKELLAICAPPSWMADTSTLVEVAECLSGGGTAWGGARSMARWAERGEGAMLALGDFAAALGDLRRGAFRRAHINAAECTNHARIAGMSDLAALAGVVTLVVERSLGEGAERAGLENAEASADVAALVRLYGAVAAGDASERESALSSLERVSPRAGLVTVLASLCGADRVSGSAIQRGLPMLWRGRTSISAEPREADAGYLGHFDSRGSGVAPGPADGRVGQGAARMGAGSAGPLGSRSAKPEFPKLEVRVLGGLSLTVDGVVVPERAWRRRHSRTLLAMLALTPGHVIPRFEAAECFWPNSDYGRWREGMYTVVSSLRATLGQVGQAGYVIGEMGRLWLNPEFVSCDIDDFEHVVRNVIGGRKPDSAVVTLCMRAEELYRGGTLRLSEDASGFFGRRHEEVRRQYVETMLEGSAAALRTGDTRQAVWFAESARVEDPCREDVLSALGRARRAEEERRAQEGRRDKKASTKRRRKKDEGDTGEAA